MKRKAKLLVLCGFLVLLLISALVWWKKTTPDTNTATPLIGILDLDKTMHAHPRFQELEKLDEQIAELQAEAGRSAGDLAGTPGAGMQTGSIAGQANAGFHQMLEQQIAAQMAQKHQELQQIFQSKVAAIKQNINQQLSDYARELDKTYQPELLSLQLKLQTVQMTQDERDAIKKQLDALQAKRAQELQKKQAALEQEARPKLEQEQRNVEEELRQFQAKLIEQANSQMNERLKQMQAGGSPQPNTGLSMLTPQQQKYVADLQTLQDQREKLVQIMLKDAKSAAARVAANQNLEVVIVKYQQNIRAVDVTAAVITEIKK